MKHVLTATDGSDGAARAVALAAVLAHRFGAGLSIMTVGNDLMDGGAKKLASSEGDLGTALDLIMDRTLLEARASAQRLGMTNVETHAAWGDPAVAIIEAAERGNADAIVIGRRGRGRLAGLLLGSVSQKVVTLAPCPVVVVP
jgi:nucleotide-binding universal stress UspA family protein